MSLKITMKLLEEGKLKSLRPEVNKDGVIILGSRAREGLRIYYDNDEFPILAYNDPVALLWMKKVHRENHSGGTNVSAKSRLETSESLVLPGWVTPGQRTRSGVWRLSSYIQRLSNKPWGDPVT